MPRLPKWIKRTPVAIGALALPALVLFWPMLFGGRLFSSLYVNLYHEYFFAGQKYLFFTLRQWPNWWPHFASGYPISLTLDGFLNPIFILTLKFFPVLPAYAWLTFLLFVANLISCYACARAFSLTRTASLVTAIAYGFSGIIMRWTDVIVFTALFPILPLSFIAVLKINQGSRAWWWIWTALMTYAWIGGFAELMVYDLIAIGAFCITLLVAIKPLTVKTFLTDGVRKFLLPVVLSIVVISPWLVSVVYFITHDTIRAGGLALQDASSMRIGVSYLIRMFLPRLSVFYGDNIPYLRLGDDIDLFLGTVPLLLLCTLPFSWKRVCQPHRIFFVGLLAFAVLMSFRSPLYLLLHQLPVLNWFRWHFKWNFLTVFAAAMLAGYAMDGLRSFVQHPYAKHATVLFWTLFGTATVSLLAVACFGSTLIRIITAYGTAHYASLTTQNLTRSTDYYSWLVGRIAESLVREFALTNPSNLLMLGLWALALVFFSLAAWQRFSWNQSRQILLLTALLGSTVPWIGFLTGRPNQYLTESPATAKFLHASNGYRELPITTGQEKTEVPYRLFSYLPYQTIADLQDRYRISLVEHEPRAWLTRELLDDNSNTWFQVDGMFNHEPLTETRTNALFSYFMGYTSTLTKTRLDANLAFFSSTHTAEMLGMSNVKYITSVHDLAGPLKLVETNHILDQGKVPVYLYENPFFRPRWYFAEDVRWVDAGPDAQADGFKALDAIDDLRTTTLIEATAPGDATLPSKPRPEDRLRLKRYTAGNLVLAATTAEGRWVIFSETAVPFWRVRIDGRQAPLLRANLAYQAVYVPPGTHEVEFFYLDFWQQARASLAAFIEGR